MSMAAEFRLEYDGPGLAGHSMDIQVLSHSLIALDTLCREANRVLNPGHEVDVRLEMKATSQGSLEILLQFNEVGRLLAPFVPPPDVLKALGLLGGTGGLIWVLKQQMGRKITNFLGLSRGDNRVETQVTEVRGRGNTLSNTQMPMRFEGDSKPVFVIADVVYLHGDLQVRKAQQTFLDPLKKTGIEEIRVGNKERDATEKISKEEVEKGYFEVRPEEINTGFLAQPVSEEDVVLQLRTAVFEKEKKWRFSEGRKRISALITDSEFWDRVYQGKEQFGIGDLFHVVLQTTQGLSRSGRIQNQYEITHVLDIEHLGDERRIR